MFCFGFISAPGSKSPGSNVDGDETKGKLTFFKTRPFRKTRYLEKVRLRLWGFFFFCILTWSCNVIWFVLFQPFVQMPMQRRPKWLIPPEEVFIIFPPMFFVLFSSAGWCINENVAVPPAAGDD